PTHRPERPLHERARSGVVVGATRLQLTSAAVDAHHLESRRFEWPGPLVDACMAACGSHPALVWDDAGGSWVATQGTGVVRIGRGCPDAPARLGRGLVRGRARRGGCW